ncbi:type 1 periplasmic binding fold superfamily protein [Flavobacterium coralii]|uniref:type 1 periplasmic binding fold superfamily protein n=1 Tax=Flavobacterium coralii TaxID=2838017 RepID=UPI000C3E8D86|nr:type 1 periplasmic binding fold superfamily protein [Flavobacterium sp.]|tara:strand:+ start:15824 stop:16390 length:567 start_codon:yes stop_codon:yes gene_type:complete
MKHFRIPVLALAAFISLTSCNNDDEATFINEEEVITTVTATFTPTAGGDAVVLTSRDLDGDGPVAPVVTVSGDFSAGAAYTGSLTFLNETESPAESINAEIINEGDEHQIFFQQSGLGTFTYTDEDENGNPIGLAFTYQAAAAPTTGTLTITLRHEPNKNAQGVANGDITNAGGSTDASVSFTVNVTE